MDKRAQKGWVAPVSTGLTDLPSTPQTWTPGEILEGTFNNIFFIWTVNVRLIQQRCRMERIQVHTLDMPRKKKGEKEYKDGSLRLKL